MFPLIVIILTGNLARATQMKGWLLLGGLMSVALAMDAFGPFGLPVHSINSQRVIVVALVAGGLVLSKA